MKNIFVLVLSLLLSTTLMAAGGDSGGSSSKVSLYDDAVKLVKRAGKLEKKAKPNKAKKLYAQAFKKLEKAYKTDKKNPDILNYMGFTTRKIGNFNEAEKFYLEGLTLALAAEYAPNIRVNCIAPSLTNSKISNFLLKNEKMAESIAKMHPLKRIGEGGDSASVAKFLLTDESSWITGQIFGVDGGRSSVA